MKRKKVTVNSMAKYIFIIPALAFFSFAIAIPLFMGINIAFTDWNGIAKDYNYVGLQNFITMISDKRLLRPVRNTAIFAVLGTVLGNVASLGLALLVNQKLGKLSGIAKVIFFVPVCLSAILTAFLWGFIYRSVLPSLFSVKSLLGSKDYVILAITLMGVWNTCGTNMLIYLAGLKSIPTDLYEASRADGANGLQRFWNITIPMLMPSFSICVTISLTGWLREFAMTLSSTGGGPAGYSRTISIYIFENLYQYNKAGYGEAVSLVFVIVLVIIGNLVSSFFRRREVEV